MKIHVQNATLFAALAGVVFLLTPSPARAQTNTYIWADNAQGQLYQTCNAGPVSEPEYWPSNSNWTQTYQTNSNCNGTATVTNAPSNWDPADTNTPALGVGVYPGGPGAVGVNVILGAPANTFLSSGAHPILNNLTIQTNGALGVGANWSIALNRIEFQGDGEITSGSGGFLIGNGGAMIKSGGTNSFNILNPTFTGTNDLFEVDSGTLIWPSGFGAVNLTGGTFAVSNNATLLLTADSGATPMLAGNFTGVGGGTVLFNNGALAGGWSFNLPGNMFQWTGGTLEGTSTNAGVFNLTNSLGFHGARFYNNNLVNMADNSSLNCSSTGGAIYNNLGGTFNIQGNSSLLNGSLFGFNNYGLFIKSAGAGTAQITMFLNNYGGTVEVDAGTMALNGIYITNATFVVSNGATLDLATVAGNFEIEGGLTGSGGGTVLMNNGTVSSSYPTTFNFPGFMFQWAGGRLGDGTINNVTNLGTLNVSGPVGINTYFANNGTMIQSGAGGIGSGNYLYNNAGAVYDIQNDNGITVGTIYNSGLIKKSAGTGTSQIANNLTIYGPSGSLEVDSGTLALFDTGGNYFTNATLVVSNGATLDFNSENSVNYGTDIEGYLNGIGGGTLLMTNGTLLCNHPATINFPGSMFQWAGGRIGSANNNLANVGTLNVSGPVSINTYLVNNGMMIQSGTGGMNSGSQFQNNPGAVYDIQNDNGFSIGNIYNYGLIWKSAGTNTSVISGNFINYGSNGSLEVDSGTLALAGSGGNYFTNTTLVINNGAMLDLSAVTSVNPATEVEGYLNGIGSGTLLMTNGTLLCNQPTTINFPGSMFQWAGGRIGGGNNNLTNIGTLNISGPVSINNYLVNNGMMIQSGTGAMTGGNQLQNNAGGIYNIQNDSGVSVNNFYNYGLFEKTSGTGTSIIGGTFNNSGSIQVPSGVLLFTNGTFVQSAGTLELSSSLSCQDTLQVNGGTVNGVGTVGNPGLDVSLVVNGGVLAPGNPFGTLTSGGHYGFSMGSAATLSIELGGANQFSQLAVIGGSANLSGTLEVTLTNGYTPAIGTQFQIISGNRGSSTFSAQNLPHGISMTYSNAGVYLTVTSAVPAQVISPQLSGDKFGFSFGTVNGQSYTVQQNTNLAMPSWIFYTNITGNGLPYLVILPVTNLPGNYFRVSEP